MARPADGPRRPPLRDAALFGGLALVVVVGLLALSGILGMRGPSSTDAPGSEIADTSDIAEFPGATHPLASTPASALGSSTTARPSPPVARSPSLVQPTDQAPSTLPTPVATPTPTPVAGSAPSSPRDFDLQRQVIPMGFPLLRESSYQYRDNFLDVRDGPPDAYNHARIREDGSTIRLHDGIDIYAAKGEPLVAVFDGSVINPRTRWEPWEPERYGRTIVIVSNEPQTSGYIALYAHVEDVWVKPGVEVKRGQVLGTIGRTGNAELQSVRAHLHFELRAPFALDWSSYGEARTVDAFNPYPSLKAADPKRT